jgi:hypothetical protein
MKSSRSNPVIYIRNETNGFMEDEEITSLIPAVQRQVTEHFEPVWGIGAQLLFARGRVPRDAYQIVVHEQWRDDADKDYIGYHFSPDGYPIAGIFAREDKSKDGTISETLSHEVLEMLVDPACNLYARRSAAVGRPERIYFYEVCDPVQCVTYEVEGVRVCNFVYPAWFEDNWDRNPKGQHFDHKRKLKRPFEILPGCYSEIYEAKRGAMTIWGSNRRKRRFRHRDKGRRLTAQLFGRGEGAARG